MTDMEGRKTEILCVCSGKGGVGKTLFSSCLGYALTRTGLRVLMIDGDLATDGLSLFLLGPKGLEYVNSFEPSNTFAGVIAHYHATGKLEFESRQVYRNGPEDHGVVYDVLISGRSLYGERSLDSPISAIPNVDRGTFRSAVRELFGALRRSGEYDYVIVDTRGGFSFESTDLCGLADSFLVVIEADPTSFYQTRNLVQRIDDAAGDSESTSVLRGFLVNKAVDGLSESAELDLLKVESSFRNALTREFPILKYSDTYPIPADLQVLQSYKAQMVPFLGSPASLFTYATLTAYSNIFQIVTSRWTKDQVAAWQGLINSVAGAIKQKNEEAEQTRKSREAEEVAINLLRETNARYEQRIRDEEAMIDQLRKEADLARAQAAAELSRATAVEELVRSVSKIDANRKPRSWVTILIYLLMGALALVASALLWQTKLKLNVPTQKLNSAPGIPEANAPSGPDAPAALPPPSAPSIGPATKPMTCQIVPTAANWTLPGQILVKVNDKSAGSFTVGAKGSTGLKFACQPGENSIQMTESGYSGVCSLSIVAGKGPNLFVPGFLLSNGTPATCSLVPSTSSNGTSLQSAQP